MMSFQYVTIWHIYILNKKNQWNCKNLIPTLKTLNDPPFPAYLAKTDLTSSTNWLKIVEKNPQVVKSKQSLYVEKSHINGKRLKQPLTCL